MLERDATHLRRSDVAACKVGPAWIGSPVAPLMCDVDPRSRPETALEEPRQILGEFAEAFPGVKHDLGEPPVVLDEFSRTDVARLFDERLTREVAEQGIRQQRRLRPRHGALKLRSARDRRLKTDEGRHVQSALVEAARD